MRKNIGASYTKNNTCTFTVWAPAAENVELIIKDKAEAILLKKDSSGYWEKEIKEITPGTRYKFRLDREKELPDPASRSQPDGVHSWSQVIKKEFDWKDNDWKGISASEMIIYELHVGTFTPDGTFAAVTEKLDHLLELGINTIEIMPISQFPGNRNWGYDGVYPFAAQDSYGGAEELKRMINTCHQKGMAVILDAVYNHMGPEGNYLSQFGPYFTEKYETPWGSAINYDDRHSDHVRNFFTESALMWMDEFHFDGLRLDAIHEIIDRGATHFLKELRQKTDELEKTTGRKFVLIAESDLNDTKIINDYEKGGFGLEAQWVDDFHHSLHTVLTQEQEGYYADYGNLWHLGKAFKQAFVYDGIYSEFRKRTVGNNPAGLSPSKFVICIQNHDQVGNRMLGERMSQLVSFEALKLAAGAILIAPYVPMLFMGEEFGEDQPFQYFVSHTDPDLVKAVQKGRKREFEYFNGRAGEFPDPQSEDTFERSKLNWDFQGNPEKKIIFEYYKELIKLRKSGKFNALKLGKTEFVADEDNRILTITANEELCVKFNFSSESKTVKFPDSTESWNTVFMSAAKKWEGPLDYPERIKSNENFEMSANSLIICKS